MRSRLFKPNDWLAACALSAALLAGCGDKFSAGSTGTVGGAGGNSGSTTTTGGDSGASPGGTNAGGTSAAGTSAGGSANGGVGAGSVGGASGGMSAAGTGGKATSTCDCAAGTYCQDGTNKCRLCSDFSRIDFAAPEKLATLSQTKTGNERFPRAASTGADLFYRSGALGNERIYYAANPASGAGSSISPMLRDSGPLLAPGVLQQNFYFDRLQLTTNVRSIMTATWVAGQLTGEAPVSPPVNGTASDFSIAIAPGAARAYWMSSRNGKVTGAELVWASMVGPASTTVPTVVDLQVQAGAAKCPWLGGDPKTWDDDATPWVNSAGTILLFRGQSLDDKCASNDSGAFDLYAAPLSKDTGLPTAPGISLASLNTVGGGSTETDPSLSPDLCTIYYASDSGTGNNNLYRAARN